NNVGVDTSQIKIKQNVKSGLVLGLTDRKGNRALYVEPGANNLLTKEDIDLEYIKQAELLHLSSFVDDEQFEMQKFVVSEIPQSVKISFTPGAIYTRKGIDAVTPILERTYILFINESEIEELANMKYTYAARHFLDKGCQIVVVTLGRGSSRKADSHQLTFDFKNHLKILSTGGYTVDDNGNEPFMFASYVADLNNQYIIESKPGDRKDTTGAGDAFATGFLYGLLNGKESEECGRLGDIVAQFSITRIGARDGLPALTELTQRYQELYHQGL
ncbi:MAG: carbohydrate kinase family protein, partial [Chloroflexi bacterium]|nr:carbohydrate kinase family protein [Chloroflexota bacterium]